MAGCRAIEPIAYPAEQGTPQQQARLEKVKQEIVDLFWDEGHYLDLHRIPIIISQENLSHYAGVCARRDDGLSLYIQISPALFEVDADEAPGSLLNIVLHEIGHCYFLREHEQRVIEVQDHYFVFEEPTVNGRELWLTLYSVPQSIMHETFAGNAPSSLRRYYVRELLGWGRAFDAADLEAFAEFDIYEIPLFAGQ